MLTLIVATAGSIIISAICSLMEAVLYSFPESVIDNLKKDKKKSGFILGKLKNNIQEPITAILTLNTVANTLGSSVAGAAWVKEFGPETLPHFAIAFTFCIFVFSEIMPKTAGVLYARSLAPFIARPLLFLLQILHPFVKTTTFLSNKMTKNKDIAEATEDDLKSVVNMALKSGEIEQVEASTIKNVLLMNDKKAENIMTPRNVVMMFSSKDKISEVVKSKKTNFSRFPIYDDKNPTEIIGLIYKNDLYEAILDGKGRNSVKSIMKDILFVKMNEKLDVLLDKFIKSRVHMMAVRDEFGAFDGIVSLEDVIEELIGREIVDETDKIVDMQKYAKSQYKEA